MLNTNEIIRIYGTDFKANTIRLLEEADLASMIPSTKTRIGLKPNLVSASEPSFGATTHTEVLAGIIEYLQMHHFRNIVIAEGSWVGDRTPECFKICGYYELSDRYGVPLIDTQKDTSHTVNCAGMKLKICDCVKDIDFLINVPVLKGHCQTHVTCALKNMKGLIPNSEKRHFHSMGLHKPIAHLSTGIHQDFIVIDHICGDLDFEDGGNPVVRNCVMAARDPVLVDTFVCKLLHYEPEDVPYVPMAAALGSGSMDLDHAVIRTIGKDETSDLPEDRKIVALQDAVEEVESCSACYGYLIPALQQLKDEGLLDELLSLLKKATPDGKICIGQGWRGKRGAVGVGNCTSKFDFCVKGCPPTEKEVYTALKGYLLKHRGRK